jgi:hypothetical protein
MVQNNQKIVLKVEYTRFIVRKWVDGKQDCWVYLLWDLWRAVNIIVAPVENAI